MTVQGDPPVSAKAPDPADVPGVLSLRSAIAAGRLRLTGLEPAVHRTALFALGLVLLASLAIIGAALAIPMPGGVLLLPGRLVGEPVPVPVPNLAIVGFLVGLAPASVALVASALAVPRRSTRAVILAVASVNLSIGGSTLAQLPLATAVSDVDPLAPWIIAAGGGAAVAASLLLVLAGLVPPRDGLARTASRGVTALAAVPGVLLAVTYLVGLAGSATMPTPRPAGLEAFPDVLHIGAAAVAAPLYGMLARILPLVLAPIVLWEAATWARASRAELAAPVVRRVDRAPWLLVALVTAKVGWIGLGYLGRLPESLGGAAEAWAASAGRGPVAWLIAALFAGAAAAWLVKRASPKIDERGIRPGMRFVIGGFTAASVLGGALVIAAGILLLLPVTGPFELAIRLGGIAADLIQPLQIATVPVALVAGIVLLRRGRVATGGFLALAGVWMAPRALFVIAATTGLVPGDAANPLSVDLVTLDTLLTVVVAALAIALARGRRTGADAGSLALVLVVSTLMAHGGTLVPPAIASILVLAAILFPPFRELAFGSRELNEPSHVRPARVLGSLGRQGAALLLVAGTRTIVGGVGQTGFEALGHVLFGPPYAALLVAAVVTMRRRRPGAVEVAEDAVVVPILAGATGHPGRHHVTRPALGLAVGAVGLAIAVAIAGLAVDPLVGRAWEPSPGPGATPGADPSAAPAGSPDPSGSPGPTGSPGQPGDDDIAPLRAMVLEVNDRMTKLQELVNEHVGTASGEGLATAGDDLSAAAAGDLAWLTVQPVRPCFVAYRDAVARHMTAYRDFGAAVAAVGRGTGSDAEVNRLVGEIQVSLDLVVDTLSAALPACGVVVASPSPAP